MIRLLQNYYFGDGPGVPKDAPEPKGLRLLLSIFRREWWDLLRLNLLCIAFSLPLVTVPAAWFATVSVCTAMIEDRNVYLWRDFWQAFRARFAVTTGLGLALSAAVALCYFAIRTYAEGATDNLLVAAPLTVSITCSVFLPVYGAHVFAGLAKGAGRTLPDILKAAALGLLIRPLPGLLALAVVALLWLAHIAFYPTSVLLPVLVNFSVGALVMTFAVLRGVEFGLSHVVPNRPQEAGTPEGSST